MPLTDYEIVVGLEVHAELSTRTKMFCSCPNRFGAEPNTQVCPVCLGLPGALPVLNREAVVRAARAGLALHCPIAAFNKFDRKQYFYPDLDKAYQISQFDLPVCGKGHLEADVETSTGTVRRRFGITRIHMEEDAGKLLHSGAAQIGGSESSLVDYNRAGVPLIEIVSEPDLRGPEDAEAYLAALKEILRYLGVSDCNMEEGSLRCDANISVHRPGTPFGTRVEVKNMNSFKNVGKAIVSEAQRQVALIESGGVVTMETRAWDAERSETRAMRGKEEAHDYRYFPEPDLVPLELDEAWVEGVRRGLPELPEAKRRRLEAEHGLPAYDAQVLTESAELADYFEAVVRAGAQPKAASNWIMGELLAALKRLGLGVAEAPVAPGALAAMLKLLDSGVISGKIAKTVFEEMVSGGGDPAAIVERMGLTQVTDSGAIDGFARAAMEAHPAVVAEYRGGKTAGLGFLVGQVMKLSKGKANPALVNEALKRLL